MIEIRNVVMDYPLPRRFRELPLLPFIKPKYKRALRGVNLVLNDGDRVAFLGPNGAGKTTLLKLIGGLLFPTEGSISVDGKDTVKDNDAVRASVSLVMNEERTFYWRLTGRQNLEFFGALEDMQGKALKERIDMLLELTGLKDAGTALVGTYSSGMKQRLAIARGLLTDPAVLILDEPTRALDPGAAADMNAFLVEGLNRDLRKGLLVATHRLDEAALMCNRLCVVKGGTIRRDSTLAEVKAAYADVLDFYTEGVEG